MNRGIRIGVLVSGTGTNLKAIIDACRDGAIHGKVCFVASDNPQAAGLQRAQRSKIPTFSVDYRRIIRNYRQQPEQIHCPQPQRTQDELLKRCLQAGIVTADYATEFVVTRLTAESELLRQMAAYPSDLLVLAGFMRTLSPFFIDRINQSPDDPRIMNIHPALLPAFPGIDGYGDTYRYGCKVAGITVHFVDYGEDSGPIIGQSAFEINENDSLNDMRRKGLRLEWQLYPACIQLFAQNRLKIEKRACASVDGRTRYRRVVKIKEFSP